MKIVAALVFGTALALPTAASAQACDDSELYHALDFWKGEWEVMVGDRQVGTNHIEPVVGGCALIEHWVDGRGSEGKSLFYIPPQDAEWRQIWVAGPASRPGAVKEKRLVETLPDGGVRFQGTVPLPDGSSVLDRTTLTPLDGDRVRQVIQVSSDGGATWETRFDAVYVPVSRGSPHSPPRDRDLQPG